MLTGATWTAKIIGGPLDGEEGPLTDIRSEIYWASHRHIKPVTVWDDGIRSSLHVYRVESMSLRDRTVRYLYSGLA